MVVGGVGAALPIKATAVPAPDRPTAGKVYAAFFLGQGGYLFSWGIPHLASEARKLGVETDVFTYSDVTSAWAKIVRRRNDGYKIALVGYSLGNTTATYLQQHLTVDLLLAISESSLGQNHRIQKENARRSVLWYGPDMLSNGGTHDGFDAMHYIESTHLLMDVDPRVVSGVLSELKSLVTTPERRDQPIMTAARARARASAPVQTVPPIQNPPSHEKTATAPAPAQELSMSKGWLPPTNVITPDVTCTECWGLAPSLDAAPPDPWTQ